MKFPRRNFLHLAAGAAVLPAVSRIAMAQSYPSRPVRIIAATGTGGAPDIFARLMGQWLSERLGQPFVIENRPGGHLPLNEFGGQGRQLVVVSIGPAIFNRYILIFIVPSGTQATTEGVHEVCRGSSRSSVEISNYRERALLGSRRERPRHDRTRGLCDC